MPLQLSLFRRLQEREEPEPEAGASETSETEALADDLGDFTRRLAELLEDRLGSLTLTRNRSRILSSRPLPGGRLAVRIHRCFLVAPEATLAAAAAFLGGGLRGGERSRALASIRRHFEAHGTPESRPRQPASLDPVGCRFDLREIRDRLNREYFGGRLEVAITWGRRRRTTRRQRSIRLGSYQAETGLIRLHRALDRPWVPAWVLESIVYHEMLHAEHPPERRGSRRRIHGPELRRRERSFPHHERSEAWLRENLPRLLSG